MKKPKIEILENEIDRYRAALREVVQHTTDPKARRIADKGLKVQTYLAQGMSKISLDEIKKPAVLRPVLLHILFGICVYLWYW